MEHNDVEKARAVHAFNPGHLDVGSRARSGHVGRQPWWLFAASEVLGKSFDNLAYAQDAEMPIGQEGKDAAPFLR